MLPEFIEPGKPQQNGGHDRMHSSLEAEITRPPAGNLRAQQRKFDRLQAELHTERPHETLDMRTQDELYPASTRPMPDRLPAFESPDRSEVRYVSANGGIDGIGLG